ncbi:MAG: cytochrome c biogenesis protein CcdA [Candidatus Aminicenantes bacterium]|nr:cytochrome c biogenesis protein CcdA [Candidatus Aminicenantes bacterium]
MSGAENISLAAALSAGLISFLSPCILPLVPSYLAFISGVSIEELSSQENSRRVRKRVVLSALFFVLGFSIIFIALGASATFIGKFLAKHIRWVEVVGGLFIILMGLHFAGVLRIRFLDRERAVHLEKKPLGLPGTLVVGMAFGAGWTPCVGPILGSILMLAAATQSVLQGVALLAFYSAGLGIPFLVAGILIHRFFEVFQSIRKYFRAIAIAGGVLLIIMGVALLTGYFSHLTALLQ